MKMMTGVRLLRLLNSRRENALTTAEIARKWRDLGGDEVSLRSIQRYMGDLSQDSVQGPALVAVEIRKTGKSKDERSYYLRPSQVANWFMTEESALDLQFSREVYERAFGAANQTVGEKLSDMAERVTAASLETRRIRACLRIVPDGIGRLPARIDSQVLQASIEAVSKSRQLVFSYANAAGQPSDQRVSPLGLVAKDGTIYVVAIKGLSDKPRHFALHRIIKADVSHLPAQARHDFDLDDYIQASHQFSHVLDAGAGPARLKLRVAPEAMFHFRERPLSTDQSEISAPDGWHVVTATVPETVLLLPFLLSMGPSIEVMEPLTIRTKTAQWLRDAMAHYTADVAT